MPPAPPPTQPPKPTEPPPSRPEPDPRLMADLELLTRYVDAALKLEPRLDDKLMRDLRGVLSGVFTHFAKRVSR